MTDATTQRPIMTREELATHHLTEHGRDYSRSDDGYGDMEQAAKAGWRVLSGWGRDGWDLGDWPYVVISIKDTAEPSMYGTFQLQSVCEGDHDIYAFNSDADRSAALDYLFLWYQAGTGDLSIDIDREALDAGTLRVDPMYRGPFSWARCDAEKAS